MSIESDLSSIAQSLKLIAEHLTAKTTSATVVESIPVVQTPVVVQSAPTPAVIAAPALVAPAPVAPATASLSKEQFMAEVMSTYKNLGPVKGAMIQGVFVSLGANNINDLKPEQYADAIAKIKAL